MNNAQFQNAVNAGLISFVYGAHEKWTQECEKTIGGEHHPGTLDRDFQRMLNAHVAYNNPDRRNPKNDVTGFILDSSDLQARPTG